MVFSIFKKQPEKMITRPAALARPDAEEDNEELPEDIQESMDFGLTHSSLDFQVSTDVDPVNALAEESAILFASDQAQTAQTVLENAVKLQRFSSAERLWLMLFDIYRLSGQRPAFDAMCIEYVQMFEKSPPGWGRDEAADSPGTSRKGGALLFKGELLGANTTAFETAWQTLKKNGALRLDVSRIKRLDAKGCEALYQLLLYARKEKLRIDLSGQGALAALVKSSAEKVDKADRAQEASIKAAWLLLFDLLQRQGQQEVFEEMAIDYAVRFEESPPSWEVAQPAAPILQEETEDPSQENDDSVYTLDGEINTTHFDELISFAQKQDALLIDCSRLVRIDFTSAGALLNALISVRNTGKQIVFRHPNHMVAELFRVLGLTAVASCVFAKH